MWWMDPWNRLGALLVPALTAGLLVGSGWVLLVILAVRRQQPRLLERLWPRQALWSRAGQIIEADNPLWEMVLLALSIGTGVGLSVYWNAQWGTLSGRPSAVALSYLGSGLLFGVMCWAVLLALWWALFRQQDGGGDDDGGGGDGGDRRRPRPPRPSGPERPLQRRPGQLPRSAAPRRIRAPRPSRSRQPIAQGLQRPENPAQ